MIIQRANTDSAQNILQASFEVIKGWNFLLLSWSLFKIPFILKKNPNRLGLS